MSMTKKDYELIAWAVKRSGIIPDKNRVRQQGRESMRRLIANDLAGSLYGDNPKFDKNKFLKACGIEQ